MNTITLNGHNFVVTHDDGETFYTWSHAIHHSTLKKILRDHDITPKVMDLRNQVFSTYPVSTQA